MPGVLLVFLSCSLVFSALVGLCSGVLCPSKEGGGLVTPPACAWRHALFVFFRFCIQVPWRVTSFPHSAKLSVFLVCYNSGLNGETDGTEVLVGVKIRNPVVRNPRCDLSLINALEHELQIRSRNDASEERRVREYEIPGGITVLFVTGNS